MSAPIDLATVRSTARGARKLLRGADREGWWSSNGCILDQDDRTIAYGLSDTDADLVMEAPRVIADLATTVDQLADANQELRIEWVLAKLLSDTDGQHRGELRRTAVAAVSQILADSPVTADAVIDALEGLAAK